MKKKYFSKAYFLMLIIFLLPAGLYAAECSQKGVIKKTTPVFAMPPQYLTGKGWQGNVIRTLPSETQVYICEDRDVEFGFSAKTWSRIAFQDNGHWEYGWVIREDLSNWQGAGPRDTDAEIRLSFIDEAIAADQNKADWKLGAPPSGSPKKARLKPAPSPDGQVQTATYAGGVTAPIGDTVQLYWPLFVCMLLGMGAKAGVDLLYAGSVSLAKEHLRNGIVSFLVSPIVFLGFLNAGQFSTSTQTFLVLCLLSFQNGFFWQTVLKRPVSEAGAQAPAGQQAAPTR